MKISLMDLIISTYLNNFTHHPIIAEIVYVFADAPIFILPLFLLILWIKNKNNIETKKTLLHIFYACVLTTFFAIIIQHIYFVERPMTSLQAAGNMILSQIPNASFPSDHAGVSAAFLASLFLVGYKKYFFAFLPLFLIMDLCRIAGGVHWPSDIGAGILLGTLSAYMIFKSQKMFTKLDEFFLRIASFFKL